MLKQVAGDPEPLLKEIKNGLIIQPGFEMTGFVFPKEVDYIYIFRLREKKYLEHELLKNGNLLKIFDKFLSYQPTCLIFDHDFKCPDVIKSLANKYKVAVLQVNPNELAISYHLQNFLSEAFAPVTEIHATCVSLFGCGLLILGPSGIGKSECTLELIKKKHLFVCDDRVIIKRVGNRLFGSSPDVTKNLIEVRGIGILDIKKMFGIQACTNNVRINLIVKLEEWDPNKHVDRLGISPTFKNILNVDIQCFTLPVKEGRTVSELIETAVIGYLLRRDGVNAFDVLMNRINVKKKNNS